MLQIAMIVSWKGTCKTCYKPLTICSNQAPYPVGGHDDLSYSFAGKTPQYEFNPRRLVLL